MNIVGNEPLFGRLSAQFNRGALQQDQSNERGSQDEGFGAILGKMQKTNMASDGQTELAPSAVQTFASLEHGLQLASGYNLQVSIGDDALAFQARAIVGEVATPAESQQDLSEPTQITVSPSALPIAIDPDRRLADAIDKLETHPRSWPTSSQSTGSSSVNVGTAQHPPGSVSSARISGGPVEQKARITHALVSGPSQTTGDKMVERVAAQASTAPGGQPVTARANLFAHLIAAVQEYRVAVRGTKLSVDERQRLISDIRSALRSFGLADLPITLTFNNQPGDA